MTSCSTISRFYNGIIKIVRFNCSAQRKFVFFFFFGELLKGTKFQKIIVNYYKPTTMPSLSFQNMDIVMSALQQSKNGLLRLKLGFSGVSFLVVFTAV